MAALVEQMRFDRELDVRGVNCPLPLLRTKKALATMESGLVLKVVATDPGSVIDLKVFTEQTGHVMLATEEEGPEYVFLIRRK